MAIGPSFEAGEQDVERRGAVHLDEPVLRKCLERVSSTPEKKFASAITE